MQYFGARYYHPTIGRFTQIDPLEGNIFDPQSLNRYAYSRNNPIVYLDPDGRSFTTGLQGTATPLTYMYNHPVETAGFALVAGATALVAPIAVAVVGVGLSAYATGNALSNAYNAPDTDTRDYYLGQATTFGALTALGVKGAGEVGAPAKNFAGARETNESIIQFALEYAKNQGFETTGRAWSKGTLGDSLGSLVDHYVRHGEEVGAKSVSEYYSKANSFINSGTGVKLPATNGFEVWDSKTNMLAVTDRGGNTIRSFYKVTENARIKDLNQRAKRTGK